VNKSGSVRKKDDSRKQSNSSPNSFIVWFFAHIEKEKPPPANSARISRKSKAITSSILKEVDVLHFRSVPMIDISK
jgi:hypothetical protein